MGKKVVCCVTNFQRFQYGPVLQELVELKHEVSLDRCLSQCVGCSREVAAMINGQFKSFDDPGQFRQYVVESK